MSTTFRIPDATNLSFVESVYDLYLRDRDAVSAEWRAYFDSMPKPPGANGRLGPSFQPRSLFHGSNGTATASELEIEARQDRVDQLVRAYRVRGHMISLIDPLLLARPATPELDPRFYGFTEADLDRPFSSRTIKGPPVSSLREIVTRLQNTYCRFIGVQFMHIDDLGIRHWLQEKMEGSENRCQLGRTEQFRILTRLTDAVIFEEFIQKKFTGAKRFSLEGSESLIPLLDLAIERAAEMGIDEIVMGMAHRGRLNVLANILGKSPRRIFREFEDSDAEANVGRGDVKYHLGSHCDYRTSSGKSVHLALCFNPSHLEYVNPVALGRLRSKQDRLGDLSRERGMVILIHGDAAFAGEGIIQETLNLSELEAYTTGGTIHVIVNNQIGFTTPSRQGRSSIYASAIGKMLQIPIFHVNGEDPESVAQVVRLALEFRKEFKRDVIIDMYCYRKRGHNEGDEPMFTQPIMYQAIQRRKPVRESYLDHLMQFGHITHEQADAIESTLRERLESELSSMHESDKPRPTSILGALWANFKGGRDESVPEPDTGVPPDRVRALMEKTCHLPGGFQPHKTIRKLLDARIAMGRGEEPFDWAGGEALALASISAEGYRIRMSGQDCERGTFSQRHAVIHDVETGETYMPLAHVSGGRTPVEIWNSPLSEAGVLGFEYGYSIASPDALVLWEAQFGDFVNVAQPIIDQFIASAEDKWHSLSGLVMLLPHGFEGQGPEHSSARLERFLNLAAEDNLQVANPTTPAQYFHLLRRQIVRPWRKPLIVLTPKSLLRHPAAKSTVEEFASGRFQRVIADAAVPREKVKKALLCSGKVYYDLLAERESRGLADRIALIRLEQYYPLAHGALTAALETVPDGVPVVWVQEEPENMGAWYFLKVRFGDSLFGRWPLSAVHRPASASPATGSRASHLLEQSRLLDRALSL